MSQAVLSPQIDGKFAPQVSARTPLGRARLELPQVLLAGHCRVVSVIAPAGYGKSTLLAEWHEHCAQGKSAWLNLDDNDNAPQRLLQLVITALQLANPGLGSTALAQLDSRGQTAPMNVLESLASDLGQLTEPLLLFVDDVHVLVDPESVQIFEWLLRYAPQQLRLVIGSRQAPQFALGSLRLGGRLLEIDQNQLAFTAAEAQLFCTERLNAPLTPVALGRLMEKTEGWPAAIELFILALQEAADPELLLNDFWGSERSVVDYLGEVVFGRLSPDQRGLVFQFAQFERFCTPLLCEATGNSAAGDLLIELNQRKLFLLAMDRRGVWFRFHHLVQDYLRSNPPVGQAGSETNTLTAGARWFHAQGMVDEAIECSVRARDWEQACQWLAESAEDSAQRQGIGSSLLRWIKVIPRQWIDRFPVIRVNVAFSLVFSARRDEVEAELHDIERCITLWEQQQPENRVAADDLRCAAELQQLLRKAMEDVGSGFLEQVIQWLERWPNARMRYLSDAYNLAAFACKTTGEIERGLAYIQRARDIQQRDRGYYALSWNTIVEALLYLKAGDLVAARAASQRGLQLIEEHLNGYPEHAAFQHAIQASIAYEFDEIGSATLELESGTEAVDATGSADLLILTYLTRARLQFYHGNAEAGLNALRLGRQVARKRRFTRVEVTLAAEECTWLIRQNERDAALTLAHRFGFDLAIFAQHNLAADKASRVGPRLLITEAPEMAVAQLGAPLIRSKEKGFQLRRTELLVLQAAALLRCGREEEAQVAWQQAVGVCTRFGYRRVLLNDLPLLEGLLKAAKGKSAVPPPDWLVAGDKAATDGQLIEEPLTRKEIRIIKLLESGLSNRALAESIFISEGTLKWHLHNVYRKLGCKNRTGALLAARKTGYL